MDLAIFKDYDIRGTYPNQINGDVAIKVAHAIVRKFSPKTVAICRDMRVSGQEIRDALVTTFTSLGVNVFDAGLTGTEVAYFIAGVKSYDLVIMISASHNPPEYNGLKIVLKGPIAVTNESGLKDIRDSVETPPLPEAKQKGTVTMIDIWEEWKAKILTLSDTKQLKPLSVVVDAGNGMAGKMVPLVFSSLPIKVTPLFFELDGNFPNHIPNPLIKENNTMLIAKIKELHADLGLTFDGDADRIFLIDDTGRIVSGTITTALLAKYILAKYPGELILYNAICGRVVPKVIKEAGGTSKRVRVGHSFIKQYMKETGAIFAGEHSGHYYLRDYYTAESGQAVALMVLVMLSQQTKKLSQLVDELDIYPASGEINFVVSDILSVTEAIKTGFPDADSVDELDGVSVWFKDYWFNVRASKTEPLLRLNVEADTQEILTAKTNMLVKKIESLGGKRK